MDMAINLKDFAVHGRKILGAALNYHAALKAGKLQPPDKPVIFMKPSSSYITEGTKIKAPKDSQIFEECEIGVIIGKVCKDVPESEAMSYVGGYCLALDLTLTDLGGYRAKGYPWCLAKTFDTACPVSRFISVDEICDPHNIDFSCRINEKDQQKDNTSDLLFNIPQLISYCSKYMTLEPNDLILTGTGPNCGTLKSGDSIECEIEGVLCMKFEVD